MPAHRIPLEIRFWEKVNKTDTCWLWTGATMKSGYGHIKVEGRMLKAHRISYEMVVGPIPDGLEIDHLCRVRGCIRPDHLEPVDRTENLHRSPITNAGKTHCKHGHEFTPENTYNWKGKARICRTCRDRIAQNRREAS